MESKERVGASELLHTRRRLNSLPGIHGLMLLMGLPLLAACGTTQTNSATVGTEPLYTKMTDQDVAQADRTVQKTLESAVSNTTIRWRNSANGNSGSVTPQRTYQSKGGYYCRVYAETLTISGRTESYVNTACRDTDRLWKPI